MTKPRKSKQRKTPNQIEFEKQIKRINNAIKREQKKGYQFAPDILPPHPKRITKSYLDKLKKITPKYLRAQKAIQQIEEKDGFKVDKISGEIIEEPEQEYTPRISIIDRLAEELSQIPATYYYSKGRYEDKSMEINMLLSNLYDNEEEAEQQGKRNDYIKQLLNNQNELFAIISELKTKPSNQERVNGCFARIDKLISFDKYTVDDSKKLNDNFYINYEDLGNTL